MIVRTAEHNDGIFIVTICRANRRNAVDGPTAAALANAFRYFEENHKLKVAILTGEGQHFCAGADLKALSAGESQNEVNAEGDGPMGPTRMLTSKPTIAAVEGYAVAGGLELACWCDLRVAATNAIFGVFCRRFGVPLIDGGTIRLPRLIGQSRAMDMILTGRPVAADEALSFGLVNRICEPGKALDEAIKLAEELADFPQICMQHDRRSVYEQWGVSMEEALRIEFELGMATISSGETLEGTQRFTFGEGRHGKFDT